MANNSMSLREWELSAPHVTDSVSVRNLHTTVYAGVDAWGRRRAQPAQISVTIGLAHPFESAAVSDSVDNSTAHYGNLSKSILLEMDGHKGLWRGTFELASIVLTIVTGMASIDLCDIDFFYPKGSMLGDGVHVTLKSHIDTKYVQMLHIKNVRVATIIGVNRNERETKQSVVANVWIDACNTEAADSYPQVEQILVKTIEESSFETLESLAMKVVSNLTKYFILPITPGANVRVRVEKPSAVPFADAPAIEVYRRSSHDDPFGRKMLDELGWKVHRIPFPLKGSLRDHERSLQAYSQLGFRMSISDA